MNYFRLISTLLIFMLLSAGQALWAQPGRVSEAEVNTQKVFIDANKEKILGNYENAAYLYKEVIKRDKRNHAAAYELARIYDVLDKDDKALSSIQMAVSLDEQNPWYRMFLADMYEKMADFAKAADVYKQLAKEEPSVEYYQFKWAFYLVKGNKADKAIKVYDALEKTLGITEELVFKKQSLYIGMGEHKKAAAELEHLIEAYPSKLNYRHDLAEFYLRIGEEQLAEKAYKAILAIEPDNAKATIALANKNNMEGDEELGYLHSLRSIFEKPDVDIDLKIKQLIPYIHRIADGGDEKLAAAGLKLAAILTRVHPKEAKAYSAYGDLLFYSGQKEKALEKYQQAINLDNTVFTIWEQSMYIQAELADYNALRQTTEKAIDLFPNQAKAYYFNGIANSELGKHTEAVSIYQQALLMSRSKPALQLDIHKRLGIEYAHLKKYERSDKAFDQALKIKPDDVSTLHNYSLQLAHRSARLDDAKAMALRACELDANQAVLEYACGYVLYKMSDYKASRKWMEKALANGGSTKPDILEHYGDVLFQLGETDKAIGMWQQALEKGSTSKNLQKKIEERALMK